MNEGDETSSSGERPLADLPAGSSMSFTNSQSGVSGSGSMASLRATPARRRNSFGTISPSSTMDRLAGNPTPLGAIDGSPAGLGPALRLALPPRTPSADDSSPLIHSRRRMALGGAAAAEAAAAAQMNPNTGPHSSLESSPRPASSPSGALGGFGASEKEGKVLPSYAVKDDGLVRITPDTMARLLQGEFDNQIAGYTVVDCRFAYEHAGGAVKGAVNLSSPQAVLGHLLTSGQGLHAKQPLPARQTSVSKGKKHVLVFHCEFSAKRGPTLALALRKADRDRAQTQDYPACHFPELYILGGGYSSFFSSHPKLCSPEAYVPMDDPRFAQECTASLDVFRRSFPRPGARGKVLRPPPPALPPSGGDVGEDGSPLAPQLRPRRGLHARAASSIAPLASRGAFGLGASLARPSLATVESPGLGDSPLNDSPLGGLGCLGGGESDSPLGPRGGGASLGVGSPFGMLRPPAPVGGGMASGASPSPLAMQPPRRYIPPRPLALSPLGAPVEAREQDGLERDREHVGADLGHELSAGGEALPRRSSRGFAHPALESALDLPRSRATRPLGWRAAGGMGGGYAHSGHAGQPEGPEVGTDGSGGGVGSPLSLLGPPFQRAPRRHLLRTGTAPSLR